MKDPQQLKQTILEHLKPGLRIAIMSHVEPDGDGFAASLALQRVLRISGMESEIVVDQGGNLDRFGFLMRDARLREYGPGLRYDLLFVLDCNSYNRIVEREELVRTSGFSILIDHHVPENGVIKASYSFVDTSAVSVGATLWSVFRNEIEALPAEQRIAIVNCLYISIINDTNNFVNANTNAEVFDLTGQMVACGISPSELYKSYFLNHDPLEMRYIGEVLSTIELHHNNRVLWMYSTLEMQRNNKLTADSIMNITRWVQGVRGVIAMAYAREESRGSYKLSLRSPLLDVNAIASSFGGGGHRSASGATVAGELTSIKAELLDKLDQALDRLSPDA